MYVCMYVYIYIEREREIDIYIYIYTHTHSVLRSRIRGLWLRAASCRRGVQSLKPREAFRSAQVRAFDDRA